MVHILQCWFIRQIEEGAGICSTKFSVTSVSYVGHLLTADSIEPLQYFDVTKPIVLSADASQHGLGAVCLQQGAPVAFASSDG